MVAKSYCYREPKDKNLLVRLAEWRDNGNIPISAFWNIDDFIVVVKLEEEDVVFFRISFSEVPLELYHGYCVFFT